MKAFRLTLLLLIISNFYASAQHSVKGKIIDSVTGTPLAFVTLFANNSDYGTATDIDGNFDLKHHQPIAFLRLSYLGYEPKIFSTTDEKFHYVIKMTRLSYELSGIEIFPGENPALLIIQKVIDNKDRNNPEKLKAFRYHCYNKTTAEWYLDKTAYMISQNENFIPDKKDSLYLQLKEQSKDRYIMIMESYSERIFLEGKSSETVLGTRVSGFTNPNFASLATDIQPFSFYDDLFSLSVTDVKDYLSPIGNGCTGRYSYQIQDTVYSDNDSTFIISFKPAKGKIFNGLKGILYINSHFYALQHVITEPAETGLWNIKIQQKYAMTDSIHWFPVQLNYDWVIPGYPSEKVGTVLRGRSYISDVNLAPILKNSDFGADHIVYRPDAGRRSHTYWNNLRNDTLTGKEKRTYHVTDSLGKKLMFDYFSRAADKIPEGYLPVGFLDVALQYIFSYNNVEGIRTGLGIRTNEKIAPWVSLGGFFGYGFWDKKWKYGGDIDFSISKKHDLSFQLRYIKDIESPGLSSLYKFNNNTYWYDYIINRVDYIEKYSGSLSFRFLKYAQMEISAIKETREPAYTYSYISNNNDTIGGTDLRFTELRIGIRYAYKDKIVQAFNKRLSLGTNYPVIYLTYTRGFKGILDGNFPYNKLELALSKSFQFKHIGKTNIFAMGGYIWEDLPYQKLFKGNGSYSSSFMLYFKNTFQTMRVDEFAYDKYFSLLLTHDFGSRLFKIKNFKPGLILSQGILYGTLSDKNKHNDFDFTVPDKWYFESGIMFDNLVRVNILNLMYVKLGLGVYYRYGYYSFEKTLKNFSVKLGIRFSGSK